MVLSLCSTQTNPSAKISELDAYWIVGFHRPQNPVSNRSLFGRDSCFQAILSAWAVCGSGLSQF